MRLCHFRLWYSEKDVQVRFTDMFKAFVQIESSLKSVFFSFRKTRLPLLWVTIWYNTIRTRGRGMESTPPPTGFALYSRNDPYLKLLDLSQIFVTIGPSYIYVYIPMWRTMISFLSQSSFMVNIKNGANLVNIQISMDLPAGLRIQENVNRGKKRIQI